MDSIIPGDQEGVCFICGSHDRVESHHIFGASDRPVSEHYGLKVHLCNWHHHSQVGAHGRDGKSLQRYLHELGQQEIEKQWVSEGLSPEGARNRFRNEFRMSYL